MAALEAISREKSGTVRSGRQLLIVTITDGEPAGNPRETRENLRQVLMNITSNGRTHVSFAECSDQAEDMEYLDAWDGVIPKYSIVFKSFFCASPRCISFCNIGNTLFVVLLLSVVSVVLFVVLFREHLSIVSIVFVVAE